MDGEYNFEEERGDQDFDFDRFDRGDEFVEPSESQINDWNIHNDHQDNNEDEEQEDFCPCWRRDCDLDVCTVPEHFQPTDEELDIMFR
jgi:hypothetical protein